MQISKITDSMLPKTKVKVGAKGKKKDVAREAFDRWAYSRAAFSSWRRDIRKYYKAYAADPLTDADKQALQDANRINAVFSYVTTTINAVVGVDQGDRKEVRFEGITKEIDDKSYADWLTKLVRYIYQRADGHRMDSAVLFDLLICGYGWSQVYIDSFVYPFQIKMEHVDPAEMYPDPDAKDDNLSDAKWIVREHSMDAEVARMRWPDVEWDWYEEQDMDPVSSPFPRQVSADGYEDEDSSAINEEGSIYRKDGCVRILEYQYYTYERWAVYTDPQTGMSNTVQAAEFERMLRYEREQVDPETGAFLGREISGTIFFRRRVRQAWVGIGGEGNSKLLDDQELPVDEFTYKCATGLRQKDTRKGRTTRFGLMKLAYDPQMWSARALSLILEVLGRMSKSGVIMEEGAVDDPEDFESRYATPGAVLVVKDGALDRMRERNVGQWPNSLDMLFKMAQSAIADVSGISEYLKGTATGERSNVLVSNLQNQNIATLNPLLDQMQAYRMRVGFLLAKVAMSTLTDFAINRILGDPQIDGLTVQTDPASGELMPMTDELGQPVSAGKLLRQKDLLTYDVQVDTGQASPTARQAFWRMWVDTDLMGKIMQAAPDAVPDILPELVKYMPLPPEMAASLSSKFEDALKKPDLEKVFGMIQRMSPEEQQQIVQALAPPEQAAEGEGEQPPAEEAPVQ